MLSIAHSRLGTFNTYGTNVRLDGSRGFGALGATPSCPGDLVGPPTEKKPDGACYFVCRQSQLDPRYVTGGITSGTVCFPMYGGEVYGPAGAPNVLGEFKALQRAVNDAIDKTKLSVPKLIIDGQIGPNTLSAYNAVAAVTGAPQMSTTNDLALAVYTQKVASTIESAIGGFVVNTDVKQQTSDVRPKGSAALNPVEPAANMPADPSKVGKHIAWYWWALLGATAIGVTAVGISWYRGRGEDEVLFPETV